MYYSSAIKQENKLLHKLGATIQKHVPVGGSHKGP